MRFNFRFKFHGLTIFGMISKTQRLEGINSILPNGKHIILWDLENCTLEQVKAVLQQIQYEYNLSDIFILSDCAKSYRAVCFKQITFENLVHIVIDTPFTDRRYLYYLITRRYATIRLSDKKNRPKQKVVAILRNYDYPIPKQIKEVVYDTGIQKRGLSLLIGEKD